MTTRIDTIADAIFANMRDAFAAVEGVKRLSEEMQDASADSTNKREAFMATIAALSDADNWTPKETKDALKSAQNKVNDKSAAKTFATLAAEVKLAAHPEIRAHFTKLVAIRDAVWGAEQDAAVAAKKAEMPADTPCKLAFARSYHMLVAMLRRTATDEMPLIQTAGELVEWARTLDPRLDPEKVQKKLESLVAQLREFQRAFPVQDVKTLIEYAETFDSAAIVAEMRKVEEEKAKQAAAEAAREAAMLGGDEEEPSEIAPNDPVSQALGDLLPLAAE